MKAVVLGAAGGIGQPTSLLLKNSPLVTELSLYDIVAAPGVAADLSHISTPAKVTGHLPANDGLKACLEGADIVVIPAGIPRKPGMTRDDLFNKNASIVQALAEGCAKHCPNAFLLIISNPVNSTVPIVAEVLKKHNIFNPKKLFGVTTLDVVRAKTFTAELTGGKAADFNVPVVGGHSGVTIVPLLSQSQPSADSIKGEQLDQLVNRIQFGGDEVVKAKDGAGSATLSMAYAGFKMAESIIKAVKGETGIVEPTFIHLDGVPNGDVVKKQVNGLDYFSVPVELGPDGVKEARSYGKVSFTSACVQLSNSQTDRYPYRSPTTSRSSSTPACQTSRRTLPRVLPLSRRTHQSCNPLAARPASRSSSTACQRPVKQSQAKAHSPRASPPSPTDLSSTSPSSFSSFCPCHVTHPFFSRSASLSYLSDKSSLPDVLSDSACFNRFIDHARNDHYLSVLKSEILYTREEPQQPATGRSTRRPGSQEKMTTMMKMLVTWKAGRWPELLPCFTGPLTDCLTIALESTCNHRISLLTIRQLSLLPVPSLSSSSSNVTSKYQISRWSLVPHLPHLPALCSVVTSCRVMSFTIHFYASAAASVGACVCVWDTDRCEFACVLSFAALAGCGILTWIAIPGGPFGHSTPTFTFSYPRFVSTPLTSPLGNWRIHLLILLNSTTLLAASSTSSPSPPPPPPPADSHCGSGLSAGALASLRYLYVLSWRRKVPL
ncbi:malate DEHYDROGENASE, NAD-dependent [Savitreella phatthalungensis]